MPTVLDTPPRAIAADLASLKQALNVETPRPTTQPEPAHRYLEPGAFGGLTDRWEATDEDSPKRDLTGLRAIGEKAAVTANQHCDRVTARVRRYGSALTERETPH